MTTPVSTPVALLLTDLVDSAALAQQLGDAAMAVISEAHDRIARDLLRGWRGQEIDKTDGFLLLFAQATDALGYALAYHRALAEMPVPLKARAGIHVGEVTLREASAADVALGAKPVEVDGVSKPIAARVMSTALGGQTLLTPPAVAALGTIAQRVVSHGHWHVKGLPAPLELFEVGEAGAPFTPPPDSAKVFRVVRQGDLWLPVRELRHSLPAERDAFVGRRKTLQELARRFDGGTRLVSVLGIGGGGKTRLATRYGWAWMGEFPGGVWFCDLAAARSLEGLCSAVAQGLEVPLGQEDPVVQLGHAIAGRGACLVILDNFEHLARHAEATLGRWLDRAAEARFLVTTREVLGIAGEETLALAPLPADDAQALFMRRAAAAKRDFRPGADDQAAIATLVGLLDGLPLAIELAAARTRTLAPRALLARMSERFKLLSSSGGRLDRQATLRATFDWSWGLLPTAEKVALAQLSVFEGGFTLEAAEAVIDLSALPDPPWTLDVVHALVDKSFVRPLGAFAAGAGAGGAAPAGDGSAADPDTGIDRFDLLVSVQAYAAEHLATEGRYPGSGPAAVAAAHARHRAWFAALGPQRATEHACAELDNLVAACRRAVQAGDAESAAGTLEGAWAALSLRGPFTVGVALAESVGALPGLAGRAAAQVQAVWGHALETTGQRGAAIEHLQAALQLAAAADDAPCGAAVGIRLGGLQARAGQPDAARERLGLALGLARQVGDTALECAALNGLGIVDFDQGRLEQAQGHYEAALALAQRTGDRRWQGSLLGNLANLHAAQGRLEQSRALGEEGLIVMRQLGDLQREGNMVSNLGVTSFMLGDLPRASAALERGLTVARQLGHAKLECAVLGNLGQVHDAAGRLPEAVACFEAAVAAARHLGDPRLEGQLMGSMSLPHAKLRNFEAARQCLCAGETLLRDAADELSLGLLLCNRAECEWRAGHADDARSAHALASELMVASQSGPGSELGAAVARVAALLAPVS